MRIESFKITATNDLRNRPNGITPLLIRLYTLMLRLYPQPFRAAFADEMRDVFTMTLRESRGILALLTIISREVCGLPFGVWQVHRQAHHQLPAAVQRVRQIRLTVRIIASLLGVFLLSTLSGILSPSYNLYAQAVPFVVALFSATVSMLVGVMWGRVGGLLTIASGAAIGGCMSLYLYVMGFQTLGIVAVVFIGFLWALPFLIFGLLFYKFSHSQPTPVCCESPF